MSPVRFTSPLLVAALLVAAGLIAPAAAGPMEEEQLFDVPEPPTVIADNLIARLRQAAAQPDVLTRIETLKLIRAHRIDALTEQVMALLADERGLVKLEAVRALDALDHRAAAERLLPIATAAATETDNQRELVVLADELLARWGVSRAVAVWAGRLEKAEVAEALRWSAIEALGRCEIRDPAADRAVYRVVMNLQASPHLRLAAAEALGRRLDHGSEDHAATLVEGGLIGRLLAVRLLAEHRSDQAIRQLQTLGADDESAVAAAALTELLQIDARHLWPGVDRSRESADPKVRDLAVRSLAERRTPEAVAMAVEAMDDPHPEVRISARHTVRRLAADASLKPAILRMMRAMLTAYAGADRTRQADHWRHVEQAALLAGELDDKPSAPLLLALRDYNRLEVRAASIISLRELAVPNTFDPMVRYMAELIDRANNHSRRLSALNDATQEQMERITSEMGGDSRCAALVAEALGVWRVPQAVPVLKPVIKKNHLVGSSAREAGIWAIGMILEDKPDNGIVSQLAGRIRDIGGMFPEADNVRLASAIAIGRMRASAGLGTLKQFHDMTSEALQIRFAAGWAIERITGEPASPVEISPRVIRGGFITPLD